MLEFYPCLFRKPPSLPFPSTRSGPDVSRSWGCLRGLGQEGRVGKSARGREAEREAGGVCVWGGGGGGSYWGKGFIQHWGSRRGRRWWWTRKGRRRWWNRKDRLPRCGWQSWMGSSSCRKVSVRMWRTINSAAFPGGSLSRVMRLIRRRLTQAGDKDVAHKSHPAAWLHVVCLHLSFT